MSPRAAWRLETLGFTAVYDYVAGKADWFANDLPGEGTAAALPRVGQLARRDVPRCYLSEPIGIVEERVRHAGWVICVVVNERSIVLGLLRQQAMSAESQTTAEEVMRPGPTTFRPDALVTEVVERMDNRRVHGVLVTLSDGVLVGYFRREDAERSGGR
jgi:CBS domain-containing protein